MFSGFVENLSHQQTRGHEQPDIYFILINFSSFGLNLLSDESALKCVARVTQNNCMKRLETGIKDESDDSLVDRVKHIIPIKWLLQACSSL